MAISYRNCMLKVGWWLVKKGIITWWRFVLGNWIVMVGNQEKEGGDVEWWVSDLAPAFGWVPYSGNAPHPLALTACNDLSEISVHISWPGFLTSQGLGLGVCVGLEYKNMRNQVMTYWVFVWNLGMWKIKASSGLVLESRRAALEHYWLGQLVAVVGCSRSWWSK